MVRCNVVLLPRPKQQPWPTFMYMYGTVDLDLRNQTGFFAFVQGRVRAHRSLAGSQVDTIRLSVDRPLTHSTNLLQFATHSQKKKVIEGQIIKMVFEKCDGWQMACSSPSEILIVLRAFLKCIFSYKYDYYCRSMETRCWASNLAISRNAFRASFGTFQSSTNFQQWSQPTKPPPYPGPPQA